LKKHPQDLLHVLIHDEAHWGMAEKSAINNFLTSVVTETSKLIEAGKKPTLLVVFVSATIEVLTCAKQLLNTRRRVAWSWLRESDDRFKTPVRTLKYDIPILNFS
jgi:hypothetical protein